MHSIYDILNRKRRGQTLAAEEIHYLIAEYAAERLPDYQMAAFLMAVAIRGADASEQAALTRAMLESGEQWNLREWGDVVDKHSTGGVGDKISLTLAPWLAACGLPVAMLSGRGLGHTGGTLDKLDTIPGFKARLSREELERCLSDAGCVIATSTSGIAPADRKMYALRDVTGTVESIPLITASIMSKKLALGASALLLDVKVGRGAFMQSLGDARSLARSLVEAARGSGTRVEAMITDMDSPLGVACGNANEVIEAWEVLKGGGPATIRELTRAQASRLLVLMGRADEQSALAAVDEAMASGRALEAARRWIVAQGGDPDALEHPETFHAPTSMVEVRAARSGNIQEIDTYGAGMLLIDIGAGRKRAEDSIDPTAGLWFDRNRGDEVRAGEVLGRIASSRVAIDDTLAKRFEKLFMIGDEAACAQPLVVQRIQ